MKAPLKILMLEDSETDTEIVQHLLQTESGPCDFLVAMNRQSFTDSLEKQDPDIILADNSLPQFSASDALEIIHDKQLDIPFILVTGTVSEEFAANIIKSGADDYILKDRLTRLPGAIDAAIRKKKVESEKQAALESIERSNERFLLISKATKDAIWDWNLETNQVWWNENFFHLFGYDPTQPVPSVTEWMDRIHPDDKDKMAVRMNSITAKTVSSWEDEFRFRVEDGTYATVLDRTYVLTNDEGKPVRAIGALVDITEQKLLQREMEILALIARETMNSVMIFNRDTRRIHWINEGFTRGTGYTLSEMNANNPWAVLVGPDTNMETVQFINGRMENNASFERDLLIYTKQRERKWYFLCGQSIPQHNENKNHYFIIGTDITERRRTEDERLANKIERQKEISRIMLQSQETERNALGRELHDNIIQILASINLKLCYYLEEPENNLDIIENCRATLLQAIKEARDLSHHMVMPRFSDRKLRDELELLAEDYTINKQLLLDLTNIRDEQLPSPIKETLFRITQEQFSNIDKHARASRIEMRVENDAHSVCLVIRDNGVGFDPKQKRKGIGLLNIFNRVESYNGTATITSKPGAGCTLSLTMPLHV